MQNQAKILENRLRMLGDNENKEIRRIKQLEDQLDKYMKIREDHINHLSLKQKHKMYGLSYISYREIQK